MAMTRMEEAQARHISRLNEEVANLRGQRNALEHQAEKYKLGHDYYMAIQKAALENDAVMSAWEHFIVVMKLSLEESVAGLTGPLEDKIIYDHTETQLDLFLKDSPNV